MSQPADNRRPNVIFVLTDEEHTRALSCYENALGQSPTADRLAAEGALYEHAYCAYPVCFPSRAAYMTGRWPHVNGVRKNKLFLPERERHLPGVLKAEGYRTALCGKNDCFDKEALRNHFDLVWLTHHFGACDLLPDWFPPGAEGAARYYQERLKPKVWSPLGHDVIPHPPEVCDAALITEMALRFVDDSTAADNPFFLWLSYPGPHWPFTCPEAYADLFKPEDIELPPEDSLEDKPARLRANRRKLALDRDCQDALRRAIAIYLANCRYIDDQLGRVVERLGTLGIEGDTILVFTSDHGDFLGEHGGMMHKSSVFYDCLSRVPMIWRCPGRIGPGQRRPEFFEGVDLMPTVLDFCGVEAPAGVQGVSHAGGLSGTAPYPDREACFCETGIEGEPPRPEDIDPAKVPAHPLDTSVTDWLSVESQDAYFPGRGKMVRDRRWKLSCYASGEGELYDMRDDPWELTNLYDSPDHQSVVAELKDRLLRWMMDAEDTLPQ